ncbi:hypothetical protein [Sanguibacter sp. 25GB23B1]|uniref:hypothetical protein n=1 Tax=unclassified Sanguibacter TaxID=2645534 RepID=UPI0032AEE7E9
MTWLKLDDMFAWHRKVRRLSDGAFRLHVTAMNMAARDGLDGHISHEDLDDMPAIRSADKRATELVLRGLWEPSSNGWVIHDFLEYNPSREQVRAQQRASRERKARWDARRRHTTTDGQHEPHEPHEPHDEMERVGNAVTHAAATAGVTVTRPDPTRPVPVLVSSPVVRADRQTSSRHPGDAREGATIDDREMTNRG